MSSKLLSRLKFKGSYHNPLHWDQKYVLYVQLMRFGSRLHIERKKNKLSAEQLAKLCGVSRSYITLIETGKRLPGRKVIPKLAQALGLKTNIIINWYLEELRQRLK